MTVTNVSTYGSLQSVLQNIGNVQGDLNTVQQQISSGQLSQTFQGLGSSVEQYTSFNAQLDRVTDFQQSNSVTISQIQATGGAINQVVSIANTLKSLIASQTTGINSQAAFTQQVQSQLTALTSALNTSYGNKYLFSGTSTNIPAIKSPLPAPVQLGVPDTSYYQGSNRDVTTRIADNQVIVPGIRADNAAFQNLFAGIALALQSGVGTGDTTTALKKAQDLIDTGLQGTIALQASVNASVLNVQQVNTQLQSTQTYIKTLISNISSADVVSLSTQVVQDQAVLQATYSAFARISSLSIVSYLK